MAEIFTRKDIRKAVVSVLTAARIGDPGHPQPLVPAGNIIDSPATPQPPASMPSLLVYVWRDSGKGISEAGSMPLFRTTLTIVVECRVTGTAETATRDALDDLAEAVKNALLTSPAITGYADHFAGMETVIEVNGEAQRFLGNAKFALDFVYDEPFQPKIEPDFTGFNLYVDLVNLYSPTGNFAKPFDYPVAPPPRSSGPDGRVEIGATGDLTSE